MVFQASRARRGRALGEDDSGSPLACTSLGLLDGFFQLGQPADQRGIEGCRVLTILNASSATPHAMDQLTSGGTQPDLHNPVRVIQGATVKC